MPKNQGGRPPKEFDQDLFESLCGIMCTEDEICDIFKTTDKTLVNWCNRTYGMGFSDAHKMFSARGKLSLRRYQFKLAQKNASMAIFLGKNYLGQRDDIEFRDENALQKLDEILSQVRENAESKAE